nr:homer protein homolog 2-like [Leptinotarsa decemlineata]
MELVVPNVWSATLKDIISDISVVCEGQDIYEATTDCSANAKKWEIELATLKSNNARLTSALQESTANVDEWKRQLASLKEENMRMKAKYQADLENSKGGGELADELRKEIQSLRIRVDQMETELDSKNSEIKLLSSSNKSTEIQCLQKENQELQSTIKLAQSELEVALGAHESQKQVLLTLNQQLASRIHELATIHDEMTTALQT